MDNSIIDEILDLSRLSPSSCGLEPWKFMVASKENDLK
ncbi:nitroreductase family protein [Campylobacter sp.]|nr:nitroreductase family protein [Campylobacter sp.]